MKIFSERIESLRNGTQKEFAKSIGVPLNTYTNWVREIRTPSIDALHDVCIQLGVSADWLLGLSDSPHGGQGGNSATNSPGAAVGAHASVRTVTPPAPPPSGQCADCATVAALRDVIRALSPR